MVLRKGNKTGLKILTIPVGGVVLSQLEKLKIISQEKTSTGAIRYAINFFPQKEEQIEKLEKELAETKRMLDIKQASLAILMEGLNPKL